MARPNAAARPTPSTGVGREGHGQPRLLRIPVVVATLRHAPASGQGETCRLGPAEEAVGPTTVAAPDELAEAPRVAREEQAPIVAPYGAEAAGLVVAPVAHRQTPRVAVPAVDRVRLPGVGVAVRLVPGPTGVTVVDVAVAVAVPPAATALVGAPSIAGQVRRAALEVLLAADEGAGGAQTPLPTGREDAVQVVRQAAPVAGLAALPSGKPEVQTFVVQDVAPVGPAVLTGVAAAVLLATEALPEEGERTHAAVLLVPSSVHAVPLAGRGRRLEVGGTPVGGVAGAAEVAVLAPAVDAGVIEVVADAEGVLLAVAPKATEVGVAAGQVEVEGQMPVPAAVEAVARQDEGAAGVARATVPAVVAHADAARGAGEGLRRAVLLLAVARGPDGRRRASHEASAAQVHTVLAGAWRARLVAGVEGAREGALVLLLLHCRCSRCICVQSVLFVL